MSGSENETIAESTRSFDKGIFVFLAPGESCNSKLINFYSILSLWEVECGKGATTATGIGIYQSILSCSFPPILFFDVHFEVVYLTDRVFSCVLSLFWVFASSNCYDVEHWFVGMIFLKGWNVNEAMRSHIWVKVSNSLFGCFFTFHMIEVLNCVCLWWLLIAWEEPQNLNVHLANISCCVCQRNNFHGSSGHHLFDFLILVHPCLKVVN